MRLVAESRPFRLGRCAWIEWSLREGRLRAMLRVPPLAPFGCSLLLVGAALVRSVVPDPPRPVQHWAELFPPDRSTTFGAEVSETPISI